MTIAFTRSGGFAGMPGLTVRASVAIKGGGGSVSAERYARALDADEAKRLSAAAESVVSDAGRSVERRDADRSRDAFVYQFSIAIDSGASATIKTTDVAAAASPGLAELVEWARREADAIQSA